MGNGKFEGLLHLSDFKGGFKMIATDQRGSLKRMMRPSDPGSVTPEELREVKRKLIKCLVGVGSGSRATGVLVDPEYSYEREFLDSCEIRGDVGMLMGIEASGYGEGGEFEPRVRLFWGLGPEEAVLKVKRRGASAVKMLIYYRPDSPTRRHQLEMVKAVGRACMKYDIAFVLETVTHSLRSGPKKGSREFAELLPELVIGSVKELSKPEYCVDVMKVEFPADLRYSDELGQSPLELGRELDEACEVPWVVLSAGMDYDRFREVVDFACRAGASGFLAGRAIWKDSIGKSDMESYLREVGVRRVNELSEIVEERSRPWFKKFASDIGEVRVVRGE